MSTITVIPIPATDNCPHKANPTPEQLSALGFLGFLLDGLMKDAETESERAGAAEAAAAKQTLLEMGQIILRLHKLAHDNEGEIDELKEQLRVANRRCETLELLAKEG